MCFLKTATWEADIPESNPLIAYRQFMIAATDDPGLATVPAFRRLDLLPTNRLKKTWQPTADLRPGLANSSGLYAHLDPGEADCCTSGASFYARAVVLAWGHIVGHGTDGIRAEHMKVLALVPSDGAALWGYSNHPELVEEAAAKAGVDFLPVRQLDRLDEHVLFQPTTGGALREYGDNIDPSVGRSGAEYAIWRDRFRVINALWRNLGDYAGATTLASEAIDREAKSMGVNIPQSDTLRSQIEAIKVTVGEIATYLAGIEGNQPESNPSTS